MPEKTIRDMSVLERMHHSLGVRIGRSTMLSCIILGAAALLIGLVLYGMVLTQQYASQAFHLAKHTSVSVSHETDFRSLAKQIMERYRSLSPDQRAKTGTEEYRADFAASVDMGIYEYLLGMLRDVLNENDVYDVYVAMYDRETSALVYIADPEEKQRLYPGEWETMTEKEVNKFLDWDGEGELYDISRMKPYGWLCTAGVPLRDENSGEILAFVLVDISIENLLSGARSFMLEISLALLLLTTFIAWFSYTRIKKTLSQPINAIAEAAQAYSRDKKAGVSRTDHFSSLSIRTGDEIENLSLIMADMEKELAEYEENLTRIEAEKERISTELSLATRIQAAMLPSIFPAFPERKEFDIYAMMHPAREVGGDFYDFFLIDEDHLGLVMADVSGKGIPAALFMMITKTILQSCAMLGSSSAEILNKTNQAICSKNPEEMFVTVWVGILEISSGKLTCANAGHEYPVLRRPDGSFELIKDPHGFVVGGLADEVYEEYELQLEPGSQLFVYTDGVPEAMARDRSMFGISRMTEALNKEPQAGPEVLLDNVLEAVHGFVNGAEASDDITMMALEYFGPEKA